MRVCMVSYSFYESDNRVRRYAECLSARGDHVDVISLARSMEEPYGKIKGVNIYRIQRRLVNEKGELTYLFRLLKFLLLSTYQVSRMHLRERYDVIHVHNLPDFEVFSAIVPKLTGAKIILDIHDILPEFYADKFKAGKGSFAYKLLLIVEKISMAFADHIIISNHIWHERVLGRSVRNGKCSVIMNYPDPTIFYTRTVKKDPGKIILLYPGSVNKHQGLDIAILAFSRVIGKITDAEFHIIGEGAEKPALEKLIEELGLGKKVIFRGRIPLENIAEEMAKADIGIVPKLDDGFGGEAFSTKTLEFMSMGIPIIVSETRIDRYYFNDYVVKFFKPGDANDLSIAMVQLINNSDERKRYAENALEFVKGMSWEIRKKEYLDLVGV